MNTQYFSEFPVYNSQSPNSYSGDLGKYYQLLNSYAAATTWQDVLNLHTPQSAAYIEQCGMRENWTAMPKVPWQLTFASLSHDGNTAANASVIVQCLPGSLTGADYAQNDRFFVYGAKVQNGQWLFDFTVQQTEFGRYFSRTKPTVPPVQDPVIEYDVDYSVSVFPKSLSKPGSYEGVGGIEIWFGVVCQSHFLNSTSILATDTVGGTAGIGAKEGGGFDAGVLCSDATYLMVGKRYLMLGVQGIFTHGDIWAGLEINILGLTCENLEDLKQNSITNTGFFDIPSGSNQSGPPSMQATNVRVLGTFTRQYRVGIGKVEIPIDEIVTEILPPLVVSSMDSYGASQDGYYYYYSVAHKKYLHRYKTKIVYGHTLELTHDVKPETHVLVGQYSSELPIS